MKRGLSLAAALAILLLGSSGRPAAGAAPTPGRVAAPTALLASAEESFAALRADAHAQRQRQNYTRVLSSFRQVFERYPDTRQGEQALLRSGQLLTLLFRWTGQEGDLNRAQNYYQRLTQGSPKSPFYDDALLAIAYLYLEHFKDPEQAWLRFRDVAQLAPEGNKAAEAKRQLQRLARFAPASATAPVAVATPAGRAEVPCPAPSAPVPSIGAPQTTATPVLASAPSPSKTVVPVLTQSPNRIRGIRHWSNPEYSRVVIDLEQKTNFYSNLLEDRTGGGKPRLYVDLFSSVVEERFCKPISVNDGILLGIRAAQNAADSVRVVLEIEALRTYRVFPMQDPFRIVIDVTGGAPPADAGESAAARPSASTLPAPAAPAPDADSPAPAAFPVAPPIAPVPVPELIPLPPPSREASSPEPAPPTDGIGAPRTASAVPGPAPRAAPVPGSSFSGSAARPPFANSAEATRRRASRGAAATPGAPHRTQARASFVDKPSLARQLGLGVRRVVIDAGHGAHDPGAVGVDGLQEKEVTLDLALRVGDLLRSAGYETVLTRDRDVYLPLEERTALANTARGDLFLSLHCNASDAGNLHGVETYFLNMASNLRSMQTAARENSMAIANMSDLQKIVREIQNSKMDESSQFAAIIQKALHGTLRRKFADVKDLGVKQAPFYVLIGAQMPSVLAEVSFINHRAEGKRLADPAYRQLLAQGLAEGVKRYVRSVKTASRGMPAEATQ